MKGLPLCPYCNGEVEVVKLNKKKPKDKPLYRIECLKCRKLVESGTGFLIESPRVSKERIRIFEEKLREKSYRIL